MDQQTKDQFTIEVNGVEIKVNHEKLIAADILKLAAGHGAFSGKSEEYVLESNEPEREFKTDDWVDFHEYKDFTAERSASTLVADVHEHE